NPTFSISPGNGTSTGALILGSVNDGGTARTVTISNNGTSAGSSYLAIATGATNSFSGQFVINNAAANTTAGLEIGSATQMTTQPTLGTNTVLRIRPVGTGNTGALGTVTTLNLGTANTFEGQADSATTFALDLNVTGNAILRSARVTAGA